MDDKEFNEFKDKVTSHMHRHDLWLTVVILSCAFLTALHLLRG